MDSVRFLPAGIVKMKIISDFYLAIIADKLSPRKASSLGPSCHMQPGKTFAVLHEKPLINSILIVTPHIMDNLTCAARDIFRISVSCQTNAKSRHCNLRRCVHLKSISRARQKEPNGL